MIWLVVFHQPIWKICASQNGSFRLNRDENYKIFGSHHPVMITYLPLPPNIRMKLTNKIRLIIDGTIILHINSKHQHSVRWPKKSRTQSQGQGHGAPTTKVQEFFSESKKYIIDKQEVVSPLVTSSYPEKMVELICEIVEWQWEFGTKLQTSRENTHGTWVLLVSWRYQKQRRSGHAGCHSHS